MERITKTFGELRASAEVFFDAQLDEFFEADETLTYQVYAPSTACAGAVVYISPKSGAQMPAGWKAVFDEQNLMWVGAENSGNDVHVARRVGMALLGLGLAQSSGIGAKKILAGFSGGGRVASMMMPAYPDLFTGALFICGANPFFTATPEAIGSLKTVPMVFLSGTGDFNLEDTRMAIATYEHAELPVHLFVVEGLEHALPGAPELKVALEKIKVPNDEY